MSGRRKSPTKRKSPSPRKGQRKSPKSSPQRSPQSPQRSSPRSPQRSSPRSPKVIPIPRGRGSRFSKPSSGSSKWNQLTSVHGSPTDFTFLQRPEDNWEDVADRIQARDEFEDVDPVLVKKNQYDCIDSEDRNFLEDQNAYYSVPGMEFKSSGYSKVRQEDLAEFSKNPPFHEVTPHEIEEAEIEDDWDTIEEFKNIGIGNYK